MRDSIDTIDMKELLVRNMGELLYDGEEGTVVREKGNGTLMTDIVSGKALRKVLRSLPLPELEQAVTRSEETVVVMGEDYGLHGSNPCSQWAYLKKQPPEVLDCDIRPLTMEYAALAAAHYHLVDNSDRYIRSRIEKGQMWGLFEEGKLAGFIGTHTEGSMGMLEIFPEYRRKGYGAALESYLIAWHLQRGWTPYCHVVEGNDASLHLQQSLGLQKGKLPAIWVY